MPAGVAVRAATLVPVQRRYFFLRERNSGCTRSRSAGGMSWSRISTTVMAEPSAPYTWAISRPMTPPPTMSSRAGTEPRASAAVESQMRGSSGQPGRVTGELPVARMASVKRTRVIPSAPCTSRVSGPVNTPRPVSRVTLRARQSVSRPVRNWPITRSVWPRRAARSICGGPKRSPKVSAARASSITSAACSRVLEGMQPTFRQTPPSCGPSSIRQTSRPRSAARKAAV